MRAVNKNRSSPALASIRDPVVPRRAFRRRCGPALALLTCLPHYKPWDAKEQRQPRRSADGALMWALPRAWSYARACTRPCFLSTLCVFFFYDSHQLACFGPTSARRRFLSVDGSGHLFPAARRLWRRSGARFEPRPCRSAARSERRKRKRPAARRAQEQRRRSAHASTRQRAVALHSGARRGLPNLCIPACT